MNGRRKKWIDYFNLLDALKISGCPLCNRMNALSLRFLDSLFYERVTDVGTRVNLAKAKGFCNWHVWMSMKIPNSGSGIAIIYKDLLDAEIFRFSKWSNARSLSVKSRNLRLSKKGLSAVLSSWTNKACCPVCKLIKDHERMEVGVLLDFIDEEIFCQEFEQSSGICIKHLIYIMQNFGRHPNLPLLVEKQMKKYQFLSDELGEFIRKLDYRFSKEPRGSEADSWKRVIEQFSGHREIFGNEMDRRDE
jgi:hypothetical protein